MGGEEGEGNDAPKVEAVTSANSGDSSSDSDDEVPDISVDERLVRAESCKLSGNSMFREKDNKGAMKFYKRGIELLGVLEDKKVGEILGESVLFE